MTVPGEASSASGMESSPAAKRKRNLPGMPDPDAEVIALSPKSLMATNRFVCEICGKGFQRDQNLQLHRRGHNLPWKLRQRTGEVRRRVYVCPEATCIHHDPKRALGDLTGIKKHYCRKHGEKKWKCERCTKKYAVLSDWKAHMKTCGSKEYRCDCGTLFSRKDSFTTHRAFCEVLAQETGAKEDETAKLQIVPSSPPSPSRQTLTPSNDVHSPVPSIQSSETSGNQVGAALQQQTTASGSSSKAITTASTVTTTTTTGCVFASIFAKSTTPPEVGSLLSSTPHSPSSFSDVICAATAGQDLATESMSLSLSIPSVHLPSNSLFPRIEQPQQRPPMQSAALSATALLQKAAQIGATSSTSSFLRGLGLEFPSPSSSKEQHHNGSNSFFKAESSSVNLSEQSNYVGSSRGTNPTVGRSLMFARKPTTLDLLGLGLGSGDGVGGNTADRFSALRTSIEDGLDQVAAAAAAAPFGGVNSTKNS